MSNVNEYVKSQHYAKVLNLGLSDGVICGPRIARLTLCDPTVPNAVDIQKMVKFSISNDAIVMFAGQK